MGNLESKHGTTVELRAVHVIGRAPGSDLLIDDTGASSVHATLKWDVEGWLIRDLASSNGTYVDGQVLAAGTEVKLQDGQRLRFGTQSDTWTLTATPPALHAYCSKPSGAVVRAEGEILTLPTAECPEISVHWTQRGWLVEDGSTQTPATDRMLLTTTAGVFILALPGAHPSTISTIESRRPAYLRDALLLFQISQDGDDVQLTVELGGERFDLGIRQHNELLLHLARERERDRREGFADNSCGWVYQDELCKKVSWDPQTLNVDIYRIRKQFSGLPLVDPAAVIERRPRTKRLRLGVSRHSEA